jgi:exopolysaccharide biosynthesis polyprenyl glycosylphosphotransferase
MLNYDQGFLKILIVLVTFNICMYYFDLYDSSVLNNPREVHTRLVQVEGTVCVVLAAIYFVYPSLGFGRGILMVGFIIVSILLLLCRHLFLLLNRIPRFAERALILGDGFLAETLVRELSIRPVLGTRVVGQVTGLAGIRFEDLLSSIQPYKPDRVIVALGDRRGQLPVEALLQLKDCGMRIDDGADVYEAITGKVPIESLRLSWLLFSPGFHVSRPLVIYKRLAAVIFSAIALIVALPFFALIALAIRIDSQGPVIFRQRRIGQYGKEFTLFKFRTMIDGAERDGNYLPAQPDDVRFTRVGRLLRRSRMDELPQFFNILLGDMHFVGPRPFVPNQEQECALQIPYYRQRWVVKPGATGWAQVNRGYNVTIEDNREKLGYDLFYIKNLSIGLDALILFKTMKILLLGRGSR